VFLYRVWFPDRRAYLAAMAAFTLPANAERIARDEENLFDRSRTRFFEVDERRARIGAP